jgi:hypothetical protein
VHRGHLRCWGSLDPGHGAALSLLEDPAPLGHRRPPYAGGVRLLLTNSCARGKATRDSCLDLLVLTAEGSPHIAALEHAWTQYVATAPSVAALRRVGKYAVVHLDVGDGHFEPTEFEGYSGPDWFEVQIGNALVYAVPLWERGDRVARLRAQWLPYYGGDLRRERLAAVRWWCRDHLDHIPLYVARELYFQAFDRLYLAFGLFLQGVFIARRTYPIAYNKWISHFESSEVVAKAQMLADLLDVYVTG